MCRDGTTVLALFNFHSILTFFPFYFYWGLNTYVENGPQVCIFRKHVFGFKNIWIYQIQNKCMNFLYFKSIFLNLDLTEFSIKKPNLNKIYPSYMKSFWIIEFEHFLYLTNFHLLLKQNSFIKYFII